MAKDPPRKESEKEKQARIARFVDLFEKGNAALASNDFKTCESYFAQALAVRATAGALLNLGMCENRLGYHADAAEHLSLGRERFDYDRKEKDPKAIQRFEELSLAELTAAKAQVGELEVENAPAGAKITLGIRRVFQVPLEVPIFLYPGEYTLEVRSTDGVIHTDRLRIVAGRTYTTAVPAKRSALPPSILEPAPGAPERAGAGPSLPMVVAGSAGAAAFLGAAIGFMVASEGRLSEAGRIRTQLGDVFGAQTGACHAPSGLRIDLCKQLDAATDDGAIFLYAGTAALVTSGVLGLGTTIYGLWPRDDAAPPSPTKAGGADVVRARITVGPGGAGVSIQGIF